MNKAQLESIFFYVRNDYLIVNNLMWGDREKAFHGAVLANEDARGMMAEAREQSPAKRFGVSPERGEEICACYRRRIFDVLDEATRQRILRRAQADIDNLLSCMEPLSEDTTLWRNVPESLYTGCRTGETLQWKAFSSTSLAAHDKSYHRERSFVRYVLHVPAGTPALIMGELEEVIRNEQDEVLLPPITGLVTQVRKGSSPDCAWEIELTVISHS